MALLDHQRFAVFGLGASGVGAVRLLQGLGKSVIACDQNTGFQGSFGPGVEVVLGEHRAGDATAVVLSPSFNPEWPENRAKPWLMELVARAQAGELALVSEVELALAARPRPLLTIGGTDGKSTTAALAAAILRGAGHVPALGGNSWQAMSSVVAASPEATCHTVEVSAFQLWADHGLRPNVAILTNIAPDHLDHYASEDDYVRAKFHIFRNMGAGDTAVLYADDARLRAMVPELRARGLACVGFGTRVTGDWDGTAELRSVGGVEYFVVDGAPGATQIPVSSLRLFGDHNRRNTLAALAAGRALVGRGAWDEAGVAAAIAEFGGLPHRIEHVRTLDGVGWYNDSKATNVHAAVIGLRALPAPLVALVGGVDKNLDLGPMLEVLAEKARAVVVIGQIRERFVAESAGRFQVQGAESLAEAVAACRSLSRPGDSVVLSPGCSSFDMFRSFEHRGQMFAELVQKL